MAAVVERDLRQPVRHTKGAVGAFTVYVDEQRVELKFIDLLWEKRIVAKIRQALLAEKGTK